MVIGTNCVTDGPTACRLEDLVNGPGNTIHVIETLQPLHWYKPLDTNIMAVLHSESPEQSPLGSTHDGRLNVVFCDTYLDHVDKNIDPDILQACVTRRGKQSIHSNSYPTRQNENPKGVA